MVRLLDKNLDGDCRDSGELFWQLDPASWGAQFSTVAVIDQNAVLVQRMRSTSYGVGTHRWPHEVNNTGGVTTSGGTSDYGVIDGLAQANSGAGTPINDPYGNYNVAADLNRDGVIDSTDTSIFTSTFGGAKSALASGLISDPSGPDNVFGYDGYVYNPDQGLYTVRFRWYSPTFGRWLERDPAGFVDGMSLYAYLRGGRVFGLDPSGMFSMNPLELRLWLTSTTGEQICLTKARRNAGIASESAEGGDGGRANAIKHCTWSCELVKCVGPTRAKQWGDAHEVGAVRSADPNARKEEQLLSDMDLFNNSIGRRVAKDLAKEEKEYLDKRSRMGICIAAMGYNNPWIDVWHGDSCKQRCEKEYDAGQLIQVSWDPSGKNPTDIPPGLIAVHPGTHQPMIGWPLPNDGKPIDDDSDGDQNCGCDDSHK